MDQASVLTSSSARPQETESHRERIPALWTTAVLGLVGVFAAGFGLASWVFGKVAAFDALAIPIGASGDRLNLLLLVATIIAVLAMALYVHHVRRRLAASEANAKDVAGRDVLTSLPNRLLFNELVEAELARCRRKNQNFALFYLDIDHFKQVNDKYGHDIGDQLLVAATQRVLKGLRNCDSFARLGGDEFAVLQSEIQEPRDCAALANRIIEAMSPPFALDGTQVLASVSIGIAIYPSNGQDCDSLARVADLALYRAKREGRNRFAFFEAKMSEELRLRQNAEDELRRAIDKDELTLLYQPVIAMATGQMVGVEALVRWNHRTQGLLTADRFIGIAESRGLIVPLGEWVLRRACRDAIRWPRLRMAVNVSPVQFRQQDFVASVKKIVADSGVDPSRLELELTEGVIISDAEQAERLIMDLRALGIRMALDDFGNGYSSLIYLRRFAFDKIKIDRSFLEAMEPNSESAIIVESIVKLGHALGLTVTAEGIEYEDQIEFLRDLACDELQGFFFAPPLSDREIDEKYAQLEAAEPGPAPALSRA